MAPQYCSSAGAGAAVTINVAPSVAAAALAARSPLVIVRPLPSERGRGCPDYQCNSSTLQFERHSKPTLLTLWSVPRKREAWRERAACDGLPWTCATKYGRSVFPVHEMATSLEGNAASVPSDYFHHVQGLSQFP